MGKKTNLRARVGGEEEKEEEEREFGGTAWAWTCGQTILCTFPFQSELEDRQEEKLTAVWPPLNIKPINLYLELWADGATFAQCTLVKHCVCVVCFMAPL